MITFVQSYRRKLYTSITNFSYNFLSAISKTNGKRKAGDLGEA